MAHVAKRPDSTDLVDSRGIFTGDLQDLLKLPAGSIRVLDLETLMEWEQAKVLDLSPAVQRDDVWNNNFRSRLVLAALAHGHAGLISISRSIDGCRFEVLDGKQRLTSFAMFFRGELRLDRSALGALADEPVIGTLASDLAGKVFGAGADGIGLARSNKLRKTAIAVAIVSEELKQPYFTETNSIGEKLNPMEIRKAKHPGVLLETLEAAASNRFFKRTLIKEIDHKRKKDLEIALRFMAFADLDRSLSRYSGGFGTEFDAFMRRHANDGQKAAQMKTRFDQAMWVLERIFDGAAERPFHTSYGDKSVARNLPLFDALAVGVDRVLARGYKKDYLVTKRDAIRTKVAELLGELDFRDAITLQPNHKENLAVRIATIEDALVAILGADKGRTGFPPSLRRKYLTSGQPLICAACKDPVSEVRFQLGHAISLAQGGTNDPANAVVLHDTCNRIQGAGIHIAA